MVIKEIYIDGFGIYHDFTIRDLDKGVNVILGNNEAGKSTLLQFFRYTLFGYPRLTNDKMRPLNGGSHGGRIKAVLASGEEVVFERKGDDNSIRFMYNGREYHDKTLWNKLLGNATEELYTNIFAFSQTELADIKSLDESKAEDKIYSAGLGLGNISIADIEGEILRKSEELYKIKGKKHVIGTIAAKITEINKNVKTIKECLPQFEKLSNEISALDRDLSNSGLILNEKRDEQKKLENYLRCYESFVSYENSNNELAKLPEFQELPVNGIDDLNGVEGKIQKANERIHDLTKGIEGETGIEELEENINKISFNGSLVAETGSIKYLKDNRTLYNSYLDDKIKYERDIASESKIIENKIKEINGQWTEIDVAHFNNSIVQKDKIEQIKKRFEEVEKKSSEIEAELKATRSLQSSFNSKHLSNLVSIIFLITSILGILYSLYWLGIACFIIAFLIFFGKRYYIKPDRQKELQLQLDNSKNNLKNIRRNFEAYLNEINFPNNISFETADAFIKSIEDLKDKILKKDQLADKLNTEKIPFINDFERKARELKKHLTQMGPDILTMKLADKIISQYEISDKLKSNKESLQSELSKKKKFQEQELNKLNDLYIQLKELYKMVQVENSSDFRAKYEENTRIKKFIEEKSNACSMMETIVGINKYSEVVEYLSKNEKGEIEKKVETLGQEIKEIENQKTKSSEKRGELKNELEQVESESTLAEILTEYETEKEKLFAAYKEWMAYKLSERLLKEVKGEYEKEKQPEVIKSSGKYLKEITNGNYGQIVTSIDEKKVSIYDNKGVSKKIEQLSKGTKEQLLISLRLGVIEEYDRHAEPLPMIIDEILVNSDPDRQERLARIIANFGKTRQILFFTCHPSHADLFKNGIKIIL